MARRSKPSSEPRKGTEAETTRDLVVETRTAPQPPETPGRSSTQIPHVAAERAALVGIHRAMDDDGGGGGGGGGGGDTQIPPILAVAIQSVTAQQPFVKPGGSVTIIVSGTTTITENDAAAVGSPTVTVTFAGGATQTVGVTSNGSWSCTGSATGSNTGTFANTAVGSVYYSYGFQGAPS